MAVAHGLKGSGRWWWGRTSAGGDGAARAGDDDEDGGTPTRSHEGHMVRVVGGVICM